MKTSRRDFIKFGTLATAFAGTGLFTSVSLSAQNKISADDLTVSGPTKDLFSNRTANDFRQYIGAEFLLLQSRGASSIILSEVTEASKTGEQSEQTTKSKQVKSTAKNFVLTFRVSSGKFSQATYQLWHADFGQFDLFLVPGKQSSFSLMHAVINRL